MGDGEPDGTSGRKRSTLPFDPLAGMRAMADIQADGLRAASELLERMLGSEREGTGQRQPSAERDRPPLADAWADLLARIAAGLAGSSDPGTVTLPIDSSGVGPPVRLRLDESEDATAAVEVWLHNGTSTAVGPLALRCGPLTSCDGTALENARLVFEPGEVELLAPRSSRAVLVSLAATGPRRPGTYRGTIQAEGAPNLWLPLEVEIDRC